MTKKELDNFDDELLLKIRNTFGVWDTESLRVAMQVRRLIYFILQDKKK